MQKETVIYVKFFSPGSFVAESWTEEVESLDPYTVKWPENAYAFTMYLREDIIYEGKRHKGEPTKIDSMYYHPDSKVETLEQVKINPNRGQFLVSNMELNGWNKVVWTRWGNWPQPFNEDKDIVLKN